MGVVNLTNDSFYSASVKHGFRDIVREALNMERAGASFVDIGARSTAPYKSYDVSEATEARLLSGAIKAIAKRVMIPVSADTTRLEPATKALDEGATILNDVNGLTQEEGQRLAKLVASRRCSLIISAHEATPLRQESMMKRVRTAISHSLDLALTNGVPQREIAIDPGIGFFSDKKLTNIEWNTGVLNQLSALRQLGLPICVGVSRKRFIGSITGKSVEQRLSGSLGAAAIAVYNGAHIIRTHDVSETIDAVRVAEEIRKRKRV
jgi:dihydropteroate synthase